MVKKTKDIFYYEGLGRRKTAVARVRLYIVNKEKEAMINNVKVKAGQVLLNGKDISLKFGKPFEKQQYLLPFKLTNSEERFAVSILARSGGSTGQIEAIVLGIARALEKIDKETYRPILKKQGMLMRDPRTRERRKVGTGGKARRAKQSPKR
ncbi:MAG: 30S ribosomal protein S9 [bacterium]|nr:30S ribosomal protein S9 [bacterium]